MKPRFALDLRNDEIALLHRSRAGWLPVGSVRFDAPDLEARLHQLRDTATELEPAGPTVKLVLPNAQVLYTETAARGGAGADSDEARVRQALQGATPYRVEDLAYDWQADGAAPQVLRIAVVARVTLDEAESFAAAHGFVPLSCVAVPEPGTYPGEPFFGPSNGAAAVLHEGATVERDDDVLTLAAVGLSASDALAADDIATDDIATGPEPDVAVVPAENTPEPELQPGVAEAPAPYLDRFEDSPESVATVAPESDQPDSTAPDQPEESQASDSTAPEDTSALETPTPDASPFDTTASDSVAGADEARDLWAELDAEAAEAEATETFADEPAAIVTEDTAAPVAPVAAAHSDAPPAEESPAKETRADTTPAVDTPAEETPAEDPSAEDMPAEDARAEDVPAEASLAGLDDPAPITSAPLGEDETSVAATPTPDAAKVTPSQPVDPVVSDKSVPSEPAVTFHSLRATRESPARADSDTAPRHAPTRPVPDLAVPDLTAPAAKGQSAKPASPDGNKASPEAMARADRAALAAAAGFAAGAGRKAPTGRLASLRRRFGKGDTPKPRPTQPPLDDSAGPVIGTPARAKRPAAAGPVPTPDPAAFTPVSGARSAGSLAKPGGAASAPAVSTPTTAAAKPAATAPTASKPTASKPAASKPDTSKPGGAKPQSSGNGTSVFGARPDTPRRSGRGLLVALAACLVAALLLVALWAGVLGEDERIAAVPPQASLPTDAMPEPELADEAEGDPLPDGLDPSTVATTAPTGAQSDAELAALAPQDDTVPPSTAADGAPLGDGGTSRVSDSLTADDLGVAADSQPERQALRDPGPRSDADLPDIDDPDLVGAPTAAELAARDVPDLAEAQRAYADTGIWQRPPERAAEPDDAPVDNAYLAAIDPSVGAHDAVALPPVLTDTPMAAPADPAAPDQSFALGDDGRVTPSAQGTLSPEGVLVYSGPPAVTPPARPGATGAEADLPATSSEATLAEGLVAGNPDLPDRRPVARPGDLEDTAERTQLNGYTRDQLAGLQPRARPRSLQEAVAAATEADPDDSADPSDPVATAPEAEMSDSALAVAASRLPRDRPSNIAQIVARTVAARPSQDAVAAAVASARQQAAVAPAAPVAAPAPAARRAEPEEEDEPEPVAARNQTVQPNIPTRASVAASATVKNGIRLGEVTLIGVFGTASNRRALVRLPSGRYVKVGIGDRVDGGQVAAIGKSELRYVKNGRNHVLAMPSEG